MGHQPRDGRIKERDVRFGAVVLFQGLGWRFREARLIGAACGVSDT